MQFAITDDSSSDQNVPILITLLCRKYIFVHFECIYYIFSSLSFVFVAHKFKFISFETVEQKGKLSLISARKKAHLIMSENSGQFLIVPLSFKHFCNTPVSYTQNIIN
jgi:hypothetical protein